MVWLLLMGYKMVFVKVDLLKVYVLFVLKGMIMNECMDYVFKCGGKGRLILLFLIVEIGNCWELIWFRVGVSRI